MNEARLILTCGLPGAGKTTLAKQLAEQRNAVRLSKDEWHWDLGSTPWDLTMGAKLESRLVGLAVELIGLGVSVVIDFGLWARAERDELRTLARRVGAGVELHFLDNPTDELWHRIERRNAEPPWDAHPIARSDLDHWLTVFEAPDERELALYDAPVPKPDPGSCTRRV